MIKTNKAPAGSRKERHEDFYAYLEELKSRIDIASLAQRHGFAIDKHGHTVCFNRHDQKTPSLTFYENTQSYHCFGCNAHGDAISLIQRVQGCSFWDAVNSLALEASMDLFQSNNGFDADLFGRVAGCLEAAASMYHEWLETDDSYLIKRGISYDTAKRFMIGRTRGRDDLCQSLQETGIAPDTLLLSGLVKDDGTDFFQDHIVVPIMSQGRVVDFYGRSLSDNGGSRHWGLSNDRFKVGDGLFNWQPGASNLILVEGVFDALALIQNGFPHAVGTFGTQGLSKRFLERMVRGKTQSVFVCYDGDAPGREAALREAYAIEDAGVEAIIVDLPVDQDPSDFFLANTTEDFQMLVDGALTPLDKELSLLGGLTSEQQVLALRKTILPRCQSMKPMDQTTAVKKIAQTTDLREVDIRSEIRASLQMDTQEVSAPEVVNPTQYEQINPSLHIGRHVTLITIPVMVKNPTTGEIRWEPYVVSSEHQMFPLKRDELMQRGYYCRDLVFPEKSRYSWAVIDGFQRGDCQGNLPGTYQRIRDLLRQNLDFADQTTYDYLAAYVIATYFHPVFNYFPYVHFTGTKAVGKSKTLKILGCLCFNAILSVDISDASQFRSIEAMRPTLLLDETENLQERGYSERRALLLGGYEDGPSVFRTEKDGETYRVREFDNFSPRVFASIEGLESTLASRTVQIPMQRSFNESIKDREVDRNDPEWEELRSELFLVLMSYGQHIRELNQSLDKPDTVKFDSREYNLFKPVLTIGKAAQDEPTVQALIEFANAAYLRKSDHYNDAADENIVLRALLEIIPQDGWYASDVIHRSVIEFAKAQAIEMEQALTRKRLGTLMTNMGLYADKVRRTIDGNKVRVYYVERSTLERVAENYEVSW
jgi:DNA primase catalytic core